MDVARPGKPCCPLYTEGKLTQKARFLSGGQRQRVAIARAIANNPGIILADEPTGSLDQKTGSEVMNLFREINREGKTVIVVTHDITVANRCDRCIMLLDGQVDVTALQNNQTERSLKAHRE